MIDKVYKKNENYYPKVFLGKYDFNKDTEIYSNNSYYVDSDEEYYEKMCRFIFRNIKKIWWISFKEIRKNIRHFYKLGNFYKLGTLKFPPKM